jgi:hypothetical protein
MKVIYNNIIPFKGFDATNLFGVVFARNEYKDLDKIVLNHEAIHTAQMKELLYIPFYILYGIEYLINLIKYRDGDKAYKNISFEREAYRNERQLDYLKGRRHFSQYRS